MDSRLHSFEIKENNIKIHKAIQTKFGETSILTFHYCSGFFYYKTGLSFKSAWLIVDTNTFERKVIGTPTDFEEPFVFTHYSICEKQEFINNYANNILEYYVQKMM